VSLHCSLSLLLSRANRENFFNTLWRRFRKEIAEILVTGPLVVFFAIYALSRFVFKYWFRF